ncbi:hypothetical protein BD769DRAFT_1664431 [Suillus cothurnatus]|nr:hypothetical protein BD769DRAFT_1664431 [Suillus cothurnatus]
MFQLFTLIKYIERACNALQIILINAKSSSATSSCMGHTLSHNVTWTPNHGKLLEWSTFKSASAWKKVAHPLAGTPIASTFFDSKVGLWRLSDRRTFTAFQRSALWTSCVTFSMDNKRILSGCQNKIISEWAAPKDALLEKLASTIHSCCFPAPSPSHLASFAAKTEILEINLKTITVQPCSILNSVSGTIFANRSKAKLEQYLWQDALLDAQKVIELEPSSHVGYQLKHMALHGAQRYIEAIEAFQIMLAKLDSARGMQIRKLRDKYVSPSRAEGVIRKFIDVQLHTTPLRLLNTNTGLLCDREAQIGAFKTTAEYEQLLLSIMKHADLPMEHIADTVSKYFRYAMLSHTWGENEPLLPDIQNNDVYKLKAADGLLVTWGITGRGSTRACINQNNHVELQNSLNSMFAWYRRSALTVVYLPDVPPSSKSGALAKSSFASTNKIGLHILTDHSPNHKESVEIIDELEDATGIYERVLVVFQPGMKRRSTETPMGVYACHHYAGRHRVLIIWHLRQSIYLFCMAKMRKMPSGDFCRRSWLGRAISPPSTGLDNRPNSIVVFRPTYLHMQLPHAPSHICLKTRFKQWSLRCDTLQAVDQASKLYDQLVNTSAPRFANCRLRLPCIVFPVTEVRRRSGPDHDALSTYTVKADGLDDLSITTEENLIQFSRLRPARRTFLLVHPWDRRLLELPEFADDDEENLGDYSPLDDSDESVSNLPGEEELDRFRILLACIEIDRSPRTAIRRIFASAAAGWRIQEDRIGLRYHCGSQRRVLCPYHDGHQDLRNIVASYYISLR